MFGFLLLSERAIKSNNCHPNTEGPCNISQVPKFLKIYGQNDTNFQSFLRRGMDPLAPLESTPACNLDTLIRDINVAEDNTVVGKI